MVLYSLKMPKANHWPNESTMSFTLVELVSKSMARAVLVYSFYHRTSLAIQHLLTGVSTATTERMVLQEDRVVKGHLRVIIYIGIWADPPIVKQPVSLVLFFLKM